MVGKYSSRAVLNQDRETSQWPSIRRKVLSPISMRFRNKKLELEVLADRGSRPEPWRDRYQKIIQDYDKQIKRYEVEKQKSRPSPEKLAKSRKMPKNRAGNFGYALIFLQIIDHAMLCFRFDEKRSPFSYRSGAVAGWGVLF